jgi:hypothetical protein
MRQIKKGDRFLCKETVVMDTEDVAYMAGKKYSSHYDRCITDEQGDKLHSWTNVDDEETLRYFQLVEEEGEDYREFETGSRRDSDRGKPRVADLKAYTRLRFGFHMLIGSERYGEGNFELGQPDDSTLKSIHRHLAQFELGDDSEDHLSAILFGIQMLMLNQQRTGVPVNKYYQQFKNQS